jgi:hypothetical protein
MTDPRSQSDDPAGQAPDALIEELQRLDEPGLEVPPAVDQAILTRAADHFAGRRHRQRFIFRLAATAAAAAVLVIFMLGDTLIQPRGPRASNEAQVMVLREDVDRSGQVDILDAFLLARRLDSSQSLDLQWDMNNDGVVDQRDVDALAMAAVQLPTG